MKGSPIVCVHPKMMTWIFLLQGLLLVFFTAEAQVDLGITKFERVAVDTTNVCVTTAPPKARKYVLTIDSAEKHNISEVLGNCIPFAADIAGATGENKHITLEAKNLILQVIGSDDLTINVPEFPDLTSSLLVNNEDSYNILRIQGDKKSFTYAVTPDFSASDNALGSITEYYLGYDGLEVKPCIATREAISFCDLPLSPKSINTIIGKITVESAILKYSDDGASADITLSISNDVTKVDLKSLDIMVKTPSDNILCIGNGILGITERTCTAIPWSVGSDEAEIHLVEKNNGELFNYKQHVIKDRELLASVLDPTTLEVRWLQLDTKKYKLTAIKNADGTEVGTNEVDCSGLNLEHCFSYFILTTGATYSVRLQESKAIEGYKTDSQIQSKPYSVALLSKAKKIQQIETEWLQHDDETWAVVCFHHSDNSSLEQTAFSRYEFVMINGKGQWLKHQLITERTGACCFTPFIVDMNAFDVSQGAKLIVTQRAKDGFTVLASGTSAINFDGSF